MFVGDRTAEDSWLEEKVQVWIESMKTLSGVSCKHLQSDYADMQKSVRQEW